MSWRAVVAVADPPPLRSFQIYGTERRHTTEAEAKAWCVANYRRRLKNVLAGFEWKSTVTGFEGGKPSLNYSVWEEIDGKVSQQAG